MPKATYTIRAFVEVEVDMDEDLQQDSEQLYGEAQRLLDDRLVMLDIYGARGGGVVKANVDDVRI